MLAHRPLTAGAEVSEPTAMFGREVATHEGIARMQQKEGELAIEPGIHLRQPGIPGRVDQGLVHSGVGSFDLEPRGVRSLQAPESLDPRLDLAEIELAEPANDLALDRRAKLLQVGDLTVVEARDSDPPVWLSGDEPTV